MIMQIRFGRLVYTRISVTSRNKFTNGVPYGLRFGSGLASKRYMSSYLPKLGSKTGPFSWPALGFVLLAGGGLLWYERKLIEERALKRESTELPSAGKAEIGGPFQLVDHHKKERTDKDFLGRWFLVYFGYTFCPDICPEELEKMGAVIKQLEIMNLSGHLECAFITVDPERDSSDVMQKYLKDFHPRIVGLTGTQREVDQVTKVYRIYHSKSAKDNDNDYLVDHTMYMYLMGPDGELVQYYGRNWKADEMANSIATHIKSHS